MTATLIALLPVVVCLGMMLGAAGLVIRLAGRTPLRRVPWVARRTEGEAVEPGSPA